MSGVDGLVAHAAAAVDGAGVIDDLRRLVQTPSITGSEERVAELAASLAASAGARVEQIAADPVAIAADADFPGAEMERTALPIVVARLGPPGGTRLMLQGHLDVVPIGDEATWSVGPWSAESRDGRLYGRGACDMKGGVAAILGAVRALVASGVAERLSGELVAVFVPSEEDGGQGALAAIRAGLTADMAVIAEPTSLDVVIAHAGAITFRMTVPGRAAHASKRREGVSALDNLAVLLRALEADERRRNESETDPLMTALGLPYPTIVGKIAGGEWASNVLDRVVVEGRYGVGLGQTWRDAERDLRACIEAAAAADQFLRDHPPTLAITGGRFSSARVPADHRVTTSLAAAAADVIGSRPAVRGAPYGADMRLLVNEGATPTVIFGPGDVAVAHSADEYVPVAEVETCARVLAAWVTRELATA
ncbi:MAG: ArgE/DapE family deacylase [Chloroflexota bacterium]